MLAIISCNAYHTFEQNALTTKNGTKSTGGNLKGILLRVAYIAADLQAHHILM